MVADALNPQLIRVGGGGQLQKAEPQVHSSSMPLPPAERKKIEAVHLCGPRTADFLDMIGIESFDALADTDAHELRLAVNAKLGRPFINMMGVRAFQNAINAAKQARSQRRHKS
jgi:hypothetical protein